MARLLQLLLTAFLVVPLLNGCSEDSQAPQPGQPKLAKELIFYDWAEDMPQSVLDAFTAEYGVKVTYLTYESSREAAANIRAGREYDVMVIDHPYVPELAAAGLLAEIDHRKVPNLEHLSANFRDLVFDPGNRYSVTFNWGLTGLLVRTDLVDLPVSRWADLWDQRHAGRVLLWNLERSLIGIALKSLGFSINSENKDELEMALDRLLVLKAQNRVIGYTPATALAALASGEAAITYGWAGDVLRLREAKVPVRYVLPEEGSIQWGDNFVIPAASSRKYTAEVFINFLFRPEISARIVNEQHYATANQAALPLISPEIANDPVVFPATAEMARSEIHLPLSPEGAALHERIWQRFLAGTAPQGTQQ